MPYADIVTPRPSFYRRHQPRIALVIGLLAGIFCPVSLFVFVIWSTGSDWGEKSTEDGFARFIDAIGQSILTVIALIALIIAALSAYFLAAAFVDYGDMLATFVSRLSAFIYFLIGLGTGFISFLVFSDDE